MSLPFSICEVGEVSEMSESKVDRRIQIAGIVAVAACWLAAPGIMIVELHRVDTHAVVWLLIGM